MGVATAAVIGGVAAVGGAIAGAEAGREGQRRAGQAADRARSRYAGIDVPGIRDQEINLITPELMGEYDPEMIEALGLDPSAMEDVSADAELKRKQLEALTGIEEVAEEGLSEADKAAARDIQRQVSQSDRARTEAILQNLAQRGVLGSGLELSARLDSAQQAADEQSRAADQLIQQAQANRMNALSQLGAMSGQVRSQDFGEQSQIAAAQDAINRFNVQNRQTVQGQNVGQRNLAQQQNLAARQAQEDQRAALANQQNMYNRALIQQRFQNELQLANPQAQIDMNQGQQEVAAAANQAAAWGQAGQGIGSIAGAFMGGKK